MAVAKPIIRQIKDNSESLDFFETVSLPSEDEKTRKIIMDFPTVYIHNWKDSGDFEVYVGESNNIFKRTRQHYDTANDRTQWQSKLLEKDSSLFIIGHDILINTLTKYIDWEYEHEWRIVNFNDGHRMSDGYLMDFVRPKEIILGYKNQDLLWKVDGADKKTAKMRMIVWKK